MGTILFLFSILSGKYKNCERVEVQGVSIYMQPMSLLIIPPISMFLFYFFQI